MAYYSKINHSLLFTLALFTLKLAHAEAVKIEYLVPMGFPRLKRTTHFSY